MAAGVGPDPSMEIETLQELVGDRDSARGSKNNCCGYFIGQRGSIAEVL